VAAINASGTSEVEPGMRGLWLGVLVYRWATFVWMAAVALALTVRQDLRLPGLALVAVLVILAWNVWLSLTGGWERTLDRRIDLGLALALLPLSGLVMNEEAIRNTLFFATSFPATAALTFGAGSGVAGGLFAGAALSLGLVASRAANGLPPDELTDDDWGVLFNGVFYYLSAGGAAGVVRRVLVRSAGERSLAVEEATRQREKAARLAEREALGREIHDSVLQALALLRKRGKELTGPFVSAEEIHELVELAGHQEQALRVLLSEPHAEAPEGMVSLRTTLEAAAFGVQGVPVSVTTVGPAWLFSTEVKEVQGAVRQALENVAEHANATRATVFAEALDGELVISIRDDGGGFDYDEPRLAREGKLGLLKSMKGRIEELGGSMQVHSAPGRGTEVEFRVPVRRGSDDG